MAGSPAAREMVAYLKGRMLSVERQCYFTMWCQLGRVNLLRCLFETRKINPDTTSMLSGMMDGHEEKTGLILAANKGEDGAVAVLLEWGADVTLADAEGMTALHHAVSQPELTPQRLSCVTQLLQAHAPVDARTSDGETPLMVAASEGIPEYCRILIDNGADIRAVDGKGRSVLVYAAHGGSFPVCGVLAAAAAAADAAAAAGVAVNAAVVSDVPRPTPWRRVPAADSTCDTCGETAEEAWVSAFMMCGSCRAALYCSKECQRISWRAHKAVCQTWTKAATAMMSAPPASATP